MGQAENSVSSQLKKWHGYKELNLNKNAFVKIAMNIPLKIKIRYYAKNTNTKHSNNISKNELMYFLSFCQI